MVEEYDYYYWGYEDVNKLKTRTIEHFVTLQGWGSVEAIYIERSGWDETCNGSWWTLSEIKWKGICRK